MRAPLSRLFALLSLLLLLLLSAMAQCACAAASAKLIVPWLCLENCQETQEQIAAELAQLKAYRAQVSRVSFEHYSLCAGGVLCTPYNITDVRAPLKQLGLELMPMISSYPYPPGFLDFMRTVFADPDPFIAAAVKEALDHGYWGFNVDWEPTSNATEADAVGYAAFLNRFAERMHEYGMHVTVDTATWNVLWNLTLLGQTALDTVITMQTYTHDEATFEKNLAASVAAVPPGRVGTGFCQSCGNTALSAADVKARLQLVDQYGVRQVNMWSAPVPDEWWPVLVDWQSRS